MENIGQYINILKEKTKAVQKVNLDILCQGYVDDFITIYKMDTQNLYYGTEINIQTKSTIDDITAKFFIHLPNRYNPWKQTGTNI